MLLSDGIEALDEDWLEAMLEYSQIEGVGAVGAKLLYPDGRLQHIGLVLGVCGVAAQAFDQHPGSSFGYASSAVGVRNYSAVSARLSDDAPHASSTKSAASIGSSPPTSATWTIV